MGDLDATIGAMVEGRIENESIHLSHCKLYLPEPGDIPPALVGFPRRNPGDYNNRDGFMAACDLKVSMRFGKPTEYSRLDGICTLFCGTADRFTCGQGTDTQSIIVKEGIKKQNEFF